MRFANPFLVMAVIFSLPFPFTLLSVIQLPLLILPKISASGSEPEIFQPELLALDLSLRMASLLKWKILSRKGSFPEKVTDGPPGGKRRTAGELKGVSRLKFGELEIFFAPLHTSAKVLKKFQKEVPSTTA